MNTNGFSHIDYTRKDYYSLREAMLELAKEKLPAWTDHSANDLGVVLLELFAYVGDSLFYYLDRLANESYLATAVEPRSILNLLRLIGYEVGAPKAASADLTLLFAETAGGMVTISTGSEFQTTAATIGDKIRFEYIRDPITIDLDGLPLITHSDSNSYKRFATLPVVQIDATISGEILGSSAGIAAQRFALARSPLIDNSLVVDVDEGVGIRAWEGQANFLNSTPDDEHYVVMRDENHIAWIEFGDNQYGKIPKRGRNNLIARYRVGGGIKGNVPPFTITRAVTPIAGLELVQNETAASGGQDAEVPTEAAKRAPQLFRTMGRAVTAADYEEHSKQFGVGKARARSGGWNRIELFVAPAGGGQPSDTLKEDLRSYFEKKRIMTAILDVRDPTYVNVFIEGKLEIEAYYFAQQIQQQAQNKVTEILAFEAVDFEDKLYLSKVYEAIESIEGVKGVHISRFARLDSTRDLPENGTLTFGWSEIPIAGHALGISLTVTGGRLDQ